MRLFVMWAALAIAVPCAVCGQTVETPLQVGGDVKAPRVLKRPDAHAPRAKGWQEESGECTLSVVIDEQGRVAHAEVTKSSGSAEFDRNALSAAQGYLFEPATRDGKPVAVRISIAMNYRSQRIH